MERGKVMLLAGAKMSDKQQAFDRLEPQPPPVGGTGDTLLSLATAYNKAPPEVMELFLRRRQQGVERYGTPLTILNGRNHARDGVQEAVDGLAYTQASHDELLLRAQDLTVRAPELAMQMGYLAVEAKRVRSEQYTLLMRLLMFEREYTRAIEAADKLEAQDMNRRGE